MKTFKQFINEGALDYLQPKSEEEIMKELDGWNLFNKAIKIKEFNLPDKYLPSIDEIKKELMKFSIPNDNIISMVIENNLPFELLPRNEDGICIYNGNLIIHKYTFKKLPDNFTINGYLDANPSNLERIPKNLTVKGNFFCYNNNVIEIPDDIYVEGDLYINNDVKVSDKAEIGRIEYYYENV